jgi:hypothetical protein
MEGIGDNDYWSKQLPWEQPGMIITRKFTQQTKDEKYSTDYVKT